VAASVQGSLRLRNQLPTTVETTKVATTSFHLESHSYMMQGGTAEGHDLCSYGRMPSTSVWKTLRVDLSKENVCTTLQISCPCCRKLRHSAAEDRSRGFQRWRFCVTPMPSCWSQTNCMPWGCVWHEGSRRHTAGAVARAPHECGQDYHCTPPREVRQRDPVNSRLLPIFYHMIHEEEYRVAWDRLKRSLLR
jgi:hypothetical protein